jgi:hypothetical protein
MHVCTALALSSMYIISFSGAGMMRSDGVEMCCLGPKCSACFTAHSPGIRGFYGKVCIGRDVGLYIFVVMTIS